MLKSNARGRSSRLLVLGLLIGLSVAFAQRADTQPGPGRGGSPSIVIANAPPDLVLTVKAPAQLQQGGQMWVEVSVTNTLTTVPSQGAPSLSSPAGSAANGVAVDVRFIGLDALIIQGNSGLTCQVSGSGVQPAGAYCSGGVISAGGTATIKIGVQESGNNCLTYCGPVYTDARADPANTLTERSKANNRALAVTDITGCIN